MTNLDVHFGTLAHLELFLSFSFTSSSGYRPSLTTSVREKEQTTWLVSESGNYFLNRNFFSSSFLEELFKLNVFCVFACPFVPRLCRAHIVKCKLVTVNSLFSIACGMLDEKNVLNVWSEILAKVQHISKGRWVESWTDVNWCWDMQSTAQTPAEASCVNWVLWTPSLRHAFWSQFSDHIMNAHVEEQQDCIT